MVSDLAVDRAVRQWYLRLQEPLYSKAVPFPPNTEESMPSLKAFIAGFLTVAVVLMLVNCSQRDRLAGPDPDPTVDVEKIHQAAQVAEDAFRAADPAAVRAVMTEEALGTYGADLESFTAQMPGFADAIATRQLDVYTERYAEYHYTAGSRTLSFSLVMQEDGVWKLVRF
jgi:hypothetical protein